MKNLKNVTTLSDLSINSLITLLNEKGGKYVIDTFIDENTIYYLYDKGWIHNVPLESWSWFHGEELNILMTLESKPFDSVEECKKYLRKHGVPHPDSTGDSDLTIIPQWKVKRLYKYREYGTYGIVFSKIPTIEEIQTCFGRDIQDISFDEVIKYIDENILNDDTVDIELSEAYK